MTLIIKNGVLIIDADATKTQVDEMLTWLDEYSSFVSSYSFLNGSVVTYHCCNDGYMNEYTVVKTR